MALRGRLGSALSSWPTGAVSAGDGLDDAMVQSLFATMVCEIIERRSFRTQTQARRAFFQFIEGGYNPRRRHSVLGDLSPNDFERSAVKARPRAARNGPRPVRGVSGTFWSGEPKGKTPPSGIP